MDKDTTKGKAFVLNDNIDTDQILPGYAMSAPAEELKNYVLEGSDIPDFSRKVKQGDFVVAGENFGCGSSREQAPIALKDAGVSAVIAKSFARIFRRNAINIGLPVLTGNVVDVINIGDELELDFNNFILKNLTTGETYQLDQLSPVTLETLRAGGLINKVRNTLRKRGELND